MKNLIVTVICSVVFLCSCKTNFTQTTRNRLETRGSNSVEQLQYYNDRTIQLLRVSKTEEDHIKRGKVEFKDGYYYYRINFPKETMAVAKNLEPKALKVYFEEGSDRYLIFRNFNGDFYQLAGEQKADGFHVSFEGKDFKVEEGGNALLLIKKRFDVKEDSRKRTVKGLKLD